MLSTLRSLWAWIAISLLILFWTPMLALIRVFDRDPARYRTGRWFRRLGMLMIKANPTWHVQVTGETIEDPRRPYVVVSNHLSLADIPVLSCLPWEMKWVAKIELLKIPLVGWMMQLAGDIPVDRQDPRSGARALIAARQYLRDKCSVIFFPEGTRSRDGRMLPFTDGAFRLAIQEQIPILPIAVEGTQDALPKHSWRFGEPSSIHVHLLPPIDTTGLTRADTAALRTRVRDQIIAQVATWRGTTPEAIDATVESERIEDRG